MNKIGIFYGSSTGNTKDVAKTIAAKLNVANGDMHDVASAPHDFSNYDVLLFGSSTWGIGDLQDDWEGFLNSVKGSDLAGKKVALFGCGDSSSYSDSFCDAIGKIYKAIKDKECSVIGMVAKEDYSFDTSEAEENGQFVGLPIDVDNESNKTETRVTAWVEQLKKEM